MASLDVYIPMDRRQALARGEDLPDRTTGAALFADVSGFTPLAEGLIQELGPKRAAEELTHQLSRVYDALTNEVLRYGGSIIGFAGDAITCWFDRDTGLRATACALAMQQVMARFEAVPTPAGTAVSLSIKVAVTAGQARRFLVGHPRIQTIEVLAGSILDRIAAMEQMLHRGQVAAGSKLLEELGNQALVQEWRADPAGERFAVVTGLAEPVPPAPWPEVPALSPDVARDWLLPPVYQRLQRGEGEFLAELRPAVALLLRFGGINYDADDEAGDKLDAYVRWVQTVLTRYGGYLIQLTIGDKGSFLYAAFGAPLAHDDDPVRAVAAALDLRTLPGELDYIDSVQIGLTQGQMRTGGYGGSRRRTYGVFGSEVAIASRLMLKAELGRILVSGWVAKATAYAYDFQELGPVPLKGLAEPLPVFAVRGRRREPVAGTLKGRPVTPIVGRTAERATLAERLQSLLDGRGGSVVIEGEAGIGKSRLAVDLVEQAQALGIPTLMGAGDAIERRTAYYAWRPVFRTIFGLDGTEDVEAARQQVLAQLGDDVYLRERAPLLNAVLPLSLPDNDLTAQLTGELRASNTRDLLVRVLARAPRALSALALVLEDAHWLDPASWALMAQMKREVSSLLLVVVTRPLVEHVGGAVLADEYERLLAAADTQHIRLTTLPPEETLALVCQRLGVTSLPAPVAELIRQRAEGHPFFSEEIAYALRDAGVIQIDDGRCRLAVGASELRELDFPDTIQGVITSRIDRLPPEQQLALKVASVIGRVFPLRTLHEVHPIEADKPHLADNLATLAGLDITPVETPEPELTYIFRHIITQEVAYESLLYAHRRELHHRVGECLERRYADSVEEYYELLAHHYYQSGDQDKSWDYLVKAGDKARGMYANEAAIAYYGQALSLDIDQENVYRVYESLGDVYRLIGQYERALENYQEALEHQPPTVAQIADMQCSMAKTWELQGRYDEAVQCLGLARSVLGDEQETPEMARIYSDMGWIAMRQGDCKEALRLGGKGLDVAEHLPSDERSHRVRARLQYTLGMIYYRMGDYPQAVKHLQTCIEMQESIGDLQRMSGAYNNLAVVYWSQSEYELATRYFRESLEISQKIGERYGTAMCLNNLGGIYYTLGDHPRAIEFYERGLEIARQIGDLLGIANVYTNLGEVYHSLSDHQEALRYLQEAVELFAEIRDKTNLVDAYRLLAEVELELSDAEKALDYCQRSLDLAQEIGDQEYEGIAYRVLGQIHRTSGRSEEAMRYLQSSVDTLMPIGNQLELGKSHYELGITLAAAGLEKAKEQLQEAVRIFEDLGVERELEKAHAALHQLLYE